MAIRRGTSGRDTLNGTNLDDLLFGYGGNDTLNGKAGDDTIKGGAGNDKIYGGSGADTLLGQAGNDRIDPGSDLEADIIIGGGGKDTVDYSNANDSVTVFLPINQSGVAAAGDSYSGIENVIGSSFGDNLQSAFGGTAMGGGGNDALYGSGTYNGTEDGGRIRGDAGTDTLNMSYGNTLAWVQLGQGADFINSFVEGEDKLFVKLSEFGLGNSLTSTEIRNSDTVTATGTHAQFIFEGDAQRLWFDSNGTDAGGQTLIAQFQFSTFDEGAGTPLIGINDFEWIV